MFGARGRKEEETPDWRIDFGGIFSHGRDFARLACLCMYIKWMEARKLLLPSYYNNLIRLPRNEIISNCVKSYPLPECPLPGLLLF